MAFLLFLGCLGYIGSAVLVMHHYRDSLESRGFRLKFGDTLTAGLTLSGFVGTYWHLLMLGRWSLTTLLVVCTPFAIQVIILLAVSLLV